MRRQNETDEPFVKTKTLSNGLFIAVHEMPWTDLLTMQLQVRSGTRYEGRGLYPIGTGHFVEHLVLHGNDKYPTYRDVEQTTNRRGAYNNAFTGCDETTYLLELLKEDWQFGPHLLRSLAFEPSFPEDLQVELDTIRSEIRDHNDHAEEVLDERLSLTLWGKHSTAHYPTGTEKTVSKIRRGQLENYHDQFYRASNATVVVAGGVQSEEVFGEIEAVFGSLPRAKRISFRPSPRFVGPTKTFVHPEFGGLEQSKIALGFLANDSGLEKKRSPEHVLLASILNGEIYNSLIIENRKGYSAGVVSEQTADRGTLKLTADVDPKNLQGSLQIIGEVLSSLKITDSLLDEYRALAIGNLRRAHQTTTDYADHIRYQITMGKQNPRIFLPDDIVKIYNKTTPGNLNRLKREVITPGNFVLALMGNLGGYNQKQLLQALDLR